MWQKLRRLKMPNQDRDDSACSLCHEHPVLFAGGCICRSTKPREQWLGCLHKVLRCNGTFWNQQMRDKIVSCHNPREPKLQSDCEQVNMPENLPTALKPHHTLQATQTDRQISKASLRCGLKCCRSEANVPAARKGRELPLASRKGGTNNCNGLSFSGTPLASVILFLTMAERPDTDTILRKEKRS